VDALRHLLVVAAVAVSTPATAQSGPDPVARWAPFIAEASLHYGIPVPWIVRVMRAESGGKPTLNGRPIRSPAGAIGLMQLMPVTWQAMRIACNLGANPDDPHDNIMAGTAYLRLMRDRFGYPALFAAYNAGPGRTADWLAGRARLPAETVGYLRNVTGGQASVALAAASPPPRLLFALRHDLAGAQTPAIERPARASVFAIRNGQR